MCPPSKKRTQNQWMVVGEKGLRGPSPNVREAFNVLDSDGDGRIASSDLQHFFSNSEHHYLSKREIENMISAADRDHSGYVEFEEFEGVMKELMMREDEEHREVDALEEAFRVIDTDGDGVVSFGDLKSFMEVAMQIANVSNQDVVDMMEAAGGRAESGISYKDFLALMMMMLNGSE